MPEIMQSSPDPKYRTDSVAIVSGGLDSTTLVYDMLANGYRPHLLSFDYGQRHNKELVFARRTADRLNLIHDVIDLTGITHLISNSALTSGPEPKFYDVADDIDRAVAGEATQHGIPVPEGHYAEENMKLTVVPNRNMIMLAIAGGVAVNEGARTIGIGVHAGDHPIYPDCRPEFMYEVSSAILLGNEGFDKFEPSYQAIYSPFIGKSKNDIARMAKKYGIDPAWTWSCYKGGERHCGRCGTCIERLEALSVAGFVIQASEYEDLSLFYSMVADKKFPELI
jgi:7-cyano-7-deazaguanine synthase